MSRRVVVTGIGVASPFGDYPAFSAATAAGRSAVTDRSYENYELPVAGIADFEKEEIIGGVPVSRVVRMAVRAAREAVRESGLLAIEGPARAATGVFMGVGNAPVDTICDGYPGFSATGYLDPYALLRGLPSGAATFVALDQGFQGPCHCYTTACASGSLAIGQAYRNIAEGRISRAVAGGADAPLHPGVVASWKALRALAPVDLQSPSSSCRPFDRRRRGLVLGEGAAVFVLESHSDAVARGATILAELTGFGESCDATHITRPDVAGQERCMRAAIAQHPVERIDLVVAHGTATPTGDVVEAASVTSALGARAKAVALVSNKALIGHTLGASGAFNLATAVMAVHDGTIVGTYNLDELDPRVEFDCLANRTERRSVDTVLVNCFAFGGINNSLLCSSYAP